MEENKEIKVRLSTVIYLFIIVVLIISLGLTYYLGFVADKNDNINNEQQDNLTEKIVSNTATENKKEENVVGNNKINNNIKNETDKKEETTALKGEKLIQFDTEFYDLKDISKEYRLSGKIKNYKEFKYDLDGDGKNDIIRIEANKKQEGTYIFKLNGKKFVEKEVEPEIYIVDLKKSDNTLEVILLDYATEFGKNFDVYSKSKDEMKLIGYLSGDNLKINQKGKILVDNQVTVNIYPKVYKEYAVFDDGKITTKKTNINDIKNQEFTIDKEYCDLYFTNDINNVRNFIDTLTEESNFDESLKKANIRSLSNKRTTFKILKFIEFGEMYVELSNGEKGYIFMSDGYFAG